MEGTQSAGEKICQIMLTYSEADREFGQRLAESLIKDDLDVFYPDSEVAGHTAATAIVDSKITTLVLSEMLKELANTMLSLYNKRLIVRYGVPDSS